MTHHIERGDQVPQEHATLATLSWNCQAAAHIGDSTSKYHAVTIAAQESAGPKKNHTVNVKLINTAQESRSGARKTHKNITDNFVTVNWLNHQP
jgi:hypothetical protein